MTPTNLEELKRAAEAALIRRAIAWADWCAGEGLISNDEDVPCPEDFLFEYSDIVGDEDWGTLAQRVADRHLALLAENDRLRSELEAERERNEWRPIETAPKDGTPILLGWEGNFHALTGHYEGKWGHLGFDWGFIEFPNQPTRWMPVPMCPARAHFESQEASDVR